MDWLNLSNGEQLDLNTPEFDADQRTIIPDGTSVIAAIKGAKWATDDNDNGAEMVQVTWEVVQPKEYEGTRIYHKLRVNSSKDKQRDKAVRMMTAIIVIAKVQAVMAKGLPSDDVLSSALVNKLARITVKEWEMGDNKGNWVCKVADRHAEAPVPQKSSAPADDDAPF